MANRASAVATVFLVVAAFAGCSNADLPPQPPGSSSQPPTSPAPTGPTTVKEAIAATSDGVYRIETTNCDGGVGSGTGFRVGEDLVVTAAHVVTDKRTIAVRPLDGVVKGDVIGIDADRDVALIRVDNPVSGHVFRFADGSPAVSSEVAALGYPLGLQLAPAEGEVTHLDVRVEMEDRSLKGLLQTSADVSPGNSGGPLIGEHGDVTGVVISKRTDGPGLAYAVAADVAAKRVAGWTAEPAPQSLADCRDPAGDYVKTESIHPDAPAIALTFSSYLAAIDEDDMTWAWSLLTGDRRRTYGDFENFQHDKQASQLSNFVLEKVSRRDDTTDTATVAFVTNAEPDSSDSQACRSWHTRYTLRHDSGEWLIDSATELEGSGVACPSPTEPAGDADWTETLFATPTGNIHCSLAKNTTGSSVRCDVGERTWTPPRVNCENGSGDNSLGVYDDGTPGHFECVTDDISNENVQEYGSVVKLGSVECRVESIGVTCENVDNGHGFFVSKSQYRLY